jgi:hypothetical protein
MFEKEWWKRCEKNIVTVAGLNPKYSRKIRGMKKFQVPLHEFPHLTPLFIRQSVCVCVCVCVCVRARARLPCVP